MHFGGAANRGRCRLRKAEVTNLAGPDQSTHCPDGFFDRHIGIYTMLVIEVDLLDAETLQTCIATLADIFGPAVHTEKRTLCITDIPKLGRQNHLVSAALDRPTHEFFVVPASIHVGGVEEVDAKIERPMYGGDGFLVVARAVEFRHSHAAQAERRDGQSLGSQFSLFHTQVVAIGKIQFADKLKPNPDLTRINFEGLTHPLNRSISRLTILLGRD